MEIGEQLILMHLQYTNFNQPNNSLVARGRDNEKKRVLIICILSIFIVFLTGCDLSKPLSAFSPTSSFQPSSSKISASQGGEVTLPDNTAVQVPPGALQADSQVSINKISVSDLPADPTEMSIVGSTYDINLGTTNLNKAVTLEIPFDPKLLPNGTDPSQVFLSYYDEATNKWKYAGGAVDTNRNVVVIQTSHASLWMPATWNWAAWIAVLDKMFQGSVIDWIEAVHLLTTECPQTGNYVQLDSSQSRSVVQGCIDLDDSNQPELRIVNPKSFFFEIKPVSGGNEYPSSTLLAPGEQVKFQASTADPSPLIIQAEMTQKASWYLVVHMIISMLPGANEFGIQSEHIACITERLSDVADLASAAEALVDNNGVAAAESISKFMLNGDSVRRFITSADDCHFGPAPTWSFEGFEQIGAAVSTIMSATDYIANYFAGNSTAQISFIWAPLTVKVPKGNKIAFFSDRNGNPGIYIMDLIDPKNVNTINISKDLGVDINDSIPMVWSPDGNNIAFEALQNKKIEIFIINADGSGLLNLTNNKFEAFDPSWSPDGKHFLFTSNRDLESEFNNEIYTMNTNGTNLICLTSDQSWKWAISWSPDSKKIAFIDGDGGNGISIMNADGTGLNTTALNLGVVGPPSWSPDSTQIVFSALQHGNWELYIENYDGTGLRKLLSNSEDNRDPIWSPDGSHIAYKSLDFNNTMYKISTILPDGSDIINLIQEPFLYATDCPSCPYLSFHYVWSPDSTHLAFESYRDSNMEIYVINSDGSGLVNLTKNSATDSIPVWSPGY